MNMMKSKAQRIWIRTLLVLIIILLLVVTVLTTWMVNSFTKEITELNYHLTSLVQESVDTRLKEVDNISSQIELSAANLALSRLQSKEQMNSLLSYQFGNQVRNYKLANRYIEDIYVYYPTIDYVIGDIGSFSSKNYYLLHNRLIQTGYGEWVGKISTKNKNYYFDGNALMFSRQLPYNDFAKTTASIVIKINRDEILKTLGSTKGAGTNAVTAVLGAEGQVYAAAGKDAEGVLKAIPADMLAGKALTSYRNYYILKRDSTIGGMSFVTVVDRTDLLSLANKIRNIAYLVLLGCLVIGIYLSFYISKRNHRPLLHIVNKVRESEAEAGAPAKTIDEYGLIASRIEHFLTENAKSSKRLEMQHSRIESLFLTHVLSFEERSSSEIFATMQRLDLEFLAPRFEVMVIRPHLKLDAEEIDERFRQFTQKLHEAHEHMYFISAGYQGDLVLLFNIESEVTLGELAGTAADFQPLLAELPGCITALGGVYDTLSDIARSYHQARKTAEAHQEQPGGVYVYDAASANAVPLENYAHRVMQEFARHMDEHHYDEARQLADVMFQQYVMPDEHDYLARCKKYAIVNRIVEEVQACALLHKTLDADACVGLLSGSQSLAELRRSAAEVLRLLQDTQVQPSARQHAGLAERAREIIETGYADPMLGLYSISEQLGVTNTYLSKVFKDAYDQGLAQFINQKRVEKAIELITTTSLSVKEVAVRVGYSSDVSFIRVFKQYTNTTPGKFKEKRRNAD
ncbi:helix-turn-helix domain-containing protein [Paenibacillus sp. SAF-054]|uniref:helix-turn-helix domain-containing protein n=1 Tax=unclassified Paenibacillus TaxID=185978 RepID=UPI003F7EF250